MNEEYLQSLYEYIGSNDASYKDDVSFDDFKISMGDRKYAANMYGYITDLDPTYKQDIGIKDFLDNIKGSKKKEESESNLEDGSLVSFESEVRECRVQQEDLLLSKLWNQMSISLQRLKEKPTLNI